jgi:hypothetical protein
MRARACAASEAWRHRRVVAQRGRDADGILDAREHEVVFAAWWYHRYGRRWNPKGAEHGRGGACTCDVGVRAGCAGVRVVRGSMLVLNTQSAAWWSSRTGPRLHRGLERHDGTRVFTCGWWSSRVGAVSSPAIGGTAGWDPCLHLRLVEQQDGTRVFTCDWWSSRMGAVSSPAIGRTAGWDPCLHLRLVEQQGGTRVFTCDWWNGMMGAVSSPGTGVAGWLHTIQFEDG